MSERKKSDTIAEQRKARQEFLELKKMQHGEIEAPPKPSEVAILPTTPMEKIGNFWFQYKMRVIGITAMVVVMAVLIVQCATRTRYDMEVVYFTYTSAIESQTTAIADYISKYAEDTNGDGVVNVEVINCSYSKTSQDGQYEYTSLTKLQSVLAGNKSALLYITDDETMAYLKEISGGDNLFEDETIKFTEDFYSKTFDEKYGSLPEGLQISCRQVQESVLEKKGSVAQAYSSAQKVIKSLK